jgi:hypothetical protein
MPVDEQLLARARENPASVTFDEARSLAQQLGWERTRINGSHHIFRHPLGQKIRDRYPQPLNLQEGKSGDAKPYQVRQMLDMATAMGIIEKE